MPTKPLDYCHSKIVEQLEKKYKGKKLYTDLDACPAFKKDVAAAQTDQTFFLFPRLSIDLILLERKREKLDLDAEEKVTSPKSKTANYYTLFFVISSGTILKTKLDYFKKRILFYFFYLSRASEPKRFKIIVVLPFSKSLPEKFIEFVQEYGIGLWQIDLHKRNPKFDETINPKTLREAIAYQFQLSVDNPDDIGKTVDKISKKIKIRNSTILKDAVKKGAEDFTLFFERFILDTIDAIAGVTEDDFGRRYIDRKLLNLVFNLQKVSFRETLQELVNKHLDENSDDYEFVQTVFSRLWKDNIGIKYLDFLKNFEPALLHIFAEGERKKIYRDHYIHQFHVFLLGIFIVDKLYEVCCAKCKKPEICWLIVSSFHDMAYPVELYDEWTDKFFNRIFKVKDLGHIELKSNFIDKSFLRTLGYIITRFCDTLMKEEVSGHWFSKQNDVVQCFYREITGPRKKNHSIISGISLLKLVEDKFSSKIKIDGMDFTEAFDEIFIPSALAIAIHDRNLWGKLKNPQEWLKTREGCPLPVLKFEDDPLSFILIFCDAIQEWGRPSKSTNQINKRGEEERWRRFYLKDISYFPATGFDFTIHTPLNTKDEEFFKDKEEELSETGRFLKQLNSVRFVVYLKDQNGDGRERGFIMDGGC